jgi:hypothetical protein
LRASGTLGGPVLAAWVLALGLATLLVLHPRKRTAAMTPAFGPAGRAGIVLASSLILLGFLFFNVRLDTPAFLVGGGLPLYFQDENQFGPEQGGFWTKGTAGAAIVLASPTRLSKIVLEVSSLGPGRAEIRADRFRSALDLDPRSIPPGRLIFESPRGFPWKGFYLYLIQVRGTAAFSPHALDHRSQDGRTLGLFVKIDGT